MLREILNNLFSTTSSRGRLEYAIVTAGLSAAVFLFGAFGFAAYPVKTVAFQFFSPHPCPWPRCGSSGRSAFGISAGTCHSF